MTLVKYSTKGSALTISEMDGNWDHVMARGNHTGTQPISSVDGLQGQLDDKQPAGSYAPGNALVPGGAVSGDADNALSHGSDGKPFLDASAIGEGGGAVTNVNGQTGAVTLAAADVGATPAAHASATDNPHSVSKAQVGLGNVDNTADADKPVSGATQAALDDKLDADDAADHIAGQFAPSTVWSSDETGAPEGLGKAASEPFDLEALGAGSPDAIMTAAMVKALFAAQALPVETGTATIGFTGVNASLDRVLDLDDTTDTATIVVTPLAGDGSQDGLIGYSLTVHVVTSGSEPKMLAVGLPHLADTGFPETLTPPDAGYMVLRAEIRPGRRIVWVYAGTDELRE